jgi:hypothetical protein
MRTGAKYRKPAHLRSKGTPSRWTKLPRQNDAADFDGPTSVGLEGTAYGFKDCLLALQLDHGATVEQPNQPQVIHPGDRPLTIATE